MKEIFDVVELRSILDKSREKSYRLAAYFYEEILMQVQTWQTGMGLRILLAIINKSYGCEIRKISKIGNICKIAN